MQPPRMYKTPLTLESAYRNWMHSRELAKACPQDMGAVNGDEARHRELLTALDTVKWQVSSDGS
jgi:hypothetical protein